MSRLAPLALALSLVLATSSCAGTDAGSKTPEPAAKLTATWKPGSDAPFPGSLTGEVVVPASDAAMVTISLRNARFTALPSACRQSTIVRIRSLIVDGNARLRCELTKSGDPRRIRFAAVADGATGDEMDGTVRFSEGDPGEVALPILQIGETPALSPRFRLVSSPDFLNADVGDLARGPGFWNPRRSPNGINADYRRALDKVLDDWASTDPDGVFVAGDLVDGRWGRDAKGTGNFGPVRTLPQQKRALDRAAATYYPQWLQRFRQHGLDVFPAIGDHEYGDNPWPAAKRVLAPRFRARFADHFTRTRSGKARYPDHPNGPHAFTAYAGRPLPDLQMVTIDPFDITPARARLGLDPRPAQVAAQGAQQGQARQGEVDHRPRPRADPRAGADSRLEPAAPPRRRQLAGLEALREYDVDLYLAGEAHDVTVLEKGGVTQIVHGGLFQFGLTNALLLDVYDDFIYLTLRDYDVRHRDAANGPGCGRRSARACLGTSRS